MGLKKSPHEINSLMSVSERLAFWTSEDPAVVLIRAELSTIGDAIDLDEPEFVAALDALVAAGILDPDRPPVIRRGTAPHG
jgi:hypothetical protein